MGSTKVEAEMGVGTDFLICVREVDCGNLLPNWIAAAINPQTQPPCQLFCAKTESDKPRILKGGFWCIKTMMYANVFQDLI